MDAGNRLDYNLFLEIITAAHPEEIANLCQLNQRYRSYCQRPSFWSDLIMVALPGLRVSSATYQDYHYLYLLSRGLPVTRDYRDLIYDGLRQIEAEASGDELAYYQIYTYLFGTINNYTLRLVRAKTRAGALFKFDMSLPPETKVISRVFEDEAREYDKIYHNAIVTSIRPRASGNISILSDILPTKEIPEVSTVLEKIITEGLPDISIVRLDQVVMVDRQLPTNRTVYYTINPYAHPSRHRGFGVFIAATTYEEAHDLISEYTQDYVSRIVPVSPDILDNIIE